MSTRGVIAVGTPSQWRGIYNHYDSYPTGLGKELWEHLYRQILTEGKTLQDVCDNLLCFDDWRNYLAGGICEYCGKGPIGQPHSIGGNLVAAVSEGKRFPDPEAKHHQHNDLTNLASEQHTQDGLSDTWVEWVYVIEPATETIHVLCSDTKWSVVASLNLREKPDFQAVECGERLERCSHYAWAHFPELREGPCRYLGTAKYVGTKKLDYKDAIGYVINGKRYTKGGCGFSSNYRMHDTEESFPSDCWVESLVSESGERVYKPVLRNGKRGYRRYPGVKYIYPPTLLTPEVVK